MRYESSFCEFEKIPLASPFGFKGRYVRSLWQSSVRLTAGAFDAEGLGVQSVLWSDAEVLSRFGEDAGNAMMLLSTDCAARLGRGLEWSSPMELLDALFKPVYERASLTTGLQALRPTFVLNSLVALDNAAWLLIAKAKRLRSFDDMLPVQFRGPLSSRQSSLAVIPLISYGVGLDSARRLLEEGCAVLKIKIGSDPDGDGDLEKMLDWDKRRLSELHALASSFETPFTESGRVLYYLDANGRYDSLLRVEALLKHAKSIGALERIVLFEEPFAEEAKLDVSSLPARIAADESAHSEADVEERISLGYRAIALKPIAKTLSMTLRMAKAASERGVPCFCADLTVGPLLVDWNKCFAARLEPLPGMRVGVLESNGPQNYRDWGSMLAAHPIPGGSWLRPQRGAFRLDDDFYARSGGIFGSYELQSEAV